MIWLPWAVMVVVVALDQASKAAVMHYFPQLGDGCVLVPHIVNLLHVQNMGAAWGIMQGRQLWLIGCALVAMVWLIATMRRTFKPLRGGCYTWGLLAGGIVGNLIDRLWHGFVVDFIDLDFIRFPTFNLADTAISLGVAMLIVTQWLHDRAAARKGAATCQDSGN